MPDKTALSRRRFLKTAAGASALAAVPYFIPASVLGKNGAVPPSEKIVVGGIGIQHRGMHDLQWIMGQPDVQFVAICDLQKKQRSGGQELRRQALRQQGLRHVPGDPRLPGRADRTSTPC